MAQRRRLPARPHPASRSTRSGRADRGSKAKTRVPAKTGWRAMGLRTTQSPSRRPPCRPAALPPCRPAAPRHEPPSPAPRRTCPESRTHSCQIGSFMSREIMPCLPTPRLVHLVPSRRRSACPPPGARGCRTPTRPRAGPTGEPSSRGPSAGRVASVPAGRADAGAQSHPPSHAGTRARRAGARARSGGTLERPSTVFRHSCAQPDQPVRAARVSPADAPPPRPAGLRSPDRGRPGR